MSGEQLVAQRVSILVTTSHRPSQRVRSFVKDLVSVLPNAVKLTRGKATLEELYYEAIARGAKRVIIVSVWKGNPGSLRVYEPLEPPDTRLGLIARIVMKGVKLSRETPGAQRAFGARSLGVFLDAPPSSTLFSLADTLTRVFLGKIVLSRDDDSVDVVAVIRPFSEGLAEVTFLCTGSGRVCGPTLRIVGVEDLVSGFSTYKARRVEPARGKGP